MRGTMSVRVRSNSSSSNALGPFFNKLSAYLANNSGLLELPVRQTLLRFTNSLHAYDQLNLKRSYVIETLDKLRIPSESIRNQSVIGSMHSQQSIHVDLSIRTSAISG